MMMKAPKAMAPERLSVIPEIMEDDEDTLDDSNKAIIPEPQFDPMGGGSASGDLKAKLVEEDRPRPTRTRGLTLTMAEVKTAYIHANEKESTQEKNCSEIVCEAFQTPMKYLCMVTIPCLEEEKLGYVFVPALPITSLATTLILTGSILGSARIQYCCTRSSCADLGLDDIRAGDRRLGAHEDEED